MGVGTYTSEDDVVEEGSISLGEVGEGSPVSSHFLETVEMVVRVARHITVMPPPIVAGYGPETAFAPVIRAVARPTFAVCPGVRRVGQPGPRTTNSTVFSAFE